MIKTRHSLSDSDIAEAYDRIPHRIGMPPYFYPSVRKFMGEIDGKQVLDAGCGTGRLLAELSRGSTAHLYGVDLSHGLLSEARKRLPASVMLRTANLAEPLPLDGVFDIICMTEVMETLKDPVSVIRNLKRHLKDNGEFIITVPNLTAFYPLYKLASDRLPHKINMLLVPWEHPLGNPQPIDTALEYREIVGLIRDAGLQITAVRGYEYLPFLLNMLSPLKKRHLSLDDFLAGRAAHRRALRVFFKCRHDPDR